MIDLETLDTSPSAVVLTVGAVKFNRTSIVDELYIRLDVDEQIALGRTVDDGTVAWWATQPQKIQDEAMGEHNRTPVADAINKLNKFIVGCEQIWGQGYGFDMTIIENLYLQSGVNKPWNFWNLRDSRTVFKMMPTDPVNAIPKVAAHNALADAHHQARCLQWCYKQLGV
tara:strand:- start:32375 stop:32884 length:510 start_codon:yes stop_codon:yes gene_type:complete